MNQPTNIWRERALWPRAEHLRTALRLTADGVPVLPLRKGKVPFGNCPACADSACGGRPNMKAAGLCTCPAPCHAWAAAVQPPRRRPPAPTGLGERRRTTRMPPLARLLDVLDRNPLAPRPMKHRYAWPCTSAWNTPPAWCPSRTARPSNATGHRPSRKSATCSTRSAPSPSCRPTWTPPHGWTAAARTPPGGTHRGLRERTAAHPRPCRTGAHPRILQPGLRAVRLRPKRRRPPPHQPRLPPTPTSPRSHVTNPNSRSCNDPGLGHACDYGAVSIRPDGPETAQSQ